MIRPLVDQIAARLPDHIIHLSTMTETGQRKAGQTVGRRGGSFFFPLDFILIQSLAVSRLRPKSVILCETELWPNFLWLCQLLGLPVFLVNARLSTKSFPYYRALGFLFRPLIRNFSLIACQTEGDLERFRRIVGGRENMVVAGNMKYDAMAEAPSPGQWSSTRPALGLGPDQTVMVAGSTREGEEEMVLRAWQEAVSKARSPYKNRLIIAPRHPERFQRVAGNLKERGLDFARRSAGEGFTDERRIMLWDTVGELTTAYAVGDIAFVGGSLVPVGGHNPLEPAAMGLPVAFGPYMENAAESAEVLIKAGGAVQVGSAEELAEVLGAWMADGEKRRRIGISARRAVESMRGAARRTAEMVAERIKNRKVIRNNNQ